MGDRLAPESVIGMDRNTQSRCKNWPCANWKRPQDAKQATLHVQRIHATPRESERLCWNWCRPAKQSRNFATILWQARPVRCWVPSLAQTFVPWVIRANIRAARPTGSEKVSKRASSSRPMFRSPGANVGAWTEAHFCKRWRLIVVTLCNRNRADSCRAFRLFRLTVVL